MSDTGALTPANPRAAARRPYTAPRLVVYGNVSQVTHGKSGSLPDADNAGSHNVGLM